MLPGPSPAQLAGVVTWEPVVTSWLGGQWLADIPVSSGSVTWSTRRQVQGSLELTVPRQTPSRDWLPGSDFAHPLARYGQELTVVVRTSLPVSGTSWTIPLGRFVIQSWDESGGHISVTGTSMFQRIEDDRLTSPTPTRSWGTIESELRRLLPASIGLTVDDALDSRPAPTMSFGESRMEAVLELAGAWPARLREDRFGNAVALPPLDETPTPLETLTDGEGGTVVSVYGSDTRAGTFNRVVARGTDMNDAGVPSLQWVEDQLTGPMRVGGPYGTVTRMVSSSWIVTRWHAMTAARAALGDSLRRARVVPVQLAPDPRWELDDAVEVVTDSGRIWGYVSGVQVPLTVADGDMRMDVEVPT